jgi:hypothetical protein
MRHVGIGGEIATMVLLALSLIPARRALAQVRGARDAGVAVGFGASLFAAFCLALLASVVGVAALTHPGELCTKGPPSAVEPPVCGFAAIAVIAMLGAIVAFLLSFGAWWPWRPPFVAQGIRALHVLAFFCSALACYLVIY